MEYIIVFLVSIYFAHLAKKSKSRKLYSIFLFVSALFPILLAGFRDITVGTDTSNYYTKLVQALHSRTFEEYRNISDMEFGYVFFSYMCSKITDNQIVYFTLVHALVIIPIYMAISKCRTFINIKSALFVYYFLFYCSTLNITRQSIAVSLTLLALAYLFNNEKNKTILLLLLAFAFHRTAFLSLFIFVIYLFTQKYEIRKNVGIYLIIIIAILCTIYFFSQYTNVLDIIIGQREIYALYLESSGGNISKSSFILYLFVNFLVWRAYILCPNKILGFFFVISFFSVGLIFLTIISPVFSRLNIYFNIVQVLYLPYVLNNCFINLRGKKKFLVNSFSKAFMFLYILILWYFSVIIKQSNQVYPYIFA